ncbi:10060_t:CDS:2, partial [Gigaspora margarita]
CSFITNNKFIILDSYEWYYDGGVKYNFVEENLARICTIFRYPLRTEQDSEISKISTKSYEVDDILELFKKIFENKNGNCLLFFKHIECIKFYEFKDNLELLYEISIKNVENVCEKQLNFAKNIVSEIKNLKKKKYNPIEQNLTCYSAYFKFPDNFGAVPYVELAARLNSGQNMDEFQEIIFNFLPLRIKTLFRVFIHEQFVLDKNDEVSMDLEKCYRFQEDVFKINLPNLSYWVKSDFHELLNILEEYSDEFIAKEIPSELLDHLIELEKKQIFNIKILNEQIIAHMVKKSLSCLDSIEIDMKKSLKWIILLWKYLYESNTDLTLFEDIYNISTNNDKLRKLKIGQNEMIDLKSIENLYLLPQEHKYFNYQIIMPSNTIGFLAVTSEAKEATRYLLENIVEKLFERLLSSLLHLDSSFKDELGIVLEKESLNTINCKPIDLFDPNNHKIAQLFFDDEKVFPVGKFFSEHYDILKKTEN